MMTHSALAHEVHWTHQKSSRDGADIDRFIVHHAANTSVDQTLHLFDGARQVSANYALGNGRIVAAVPEEERAWTSASKYDDARAVTVEVSNSRADEPWPVSDEDFINLARLIADVANRHGFPIDDDHVLTHQELYSRFGRSYPTACPGDLQRRKPELLKLARTYASGSFVKPASPASTQEEDDEMSTNVMYVTDDVKWEYRIGIGNDTSGLWLEYVSNTPALNNELADRYKTGSGVRVGASMFAAARAAHEALRPRDQLQVAVGEADG